MSRQPSGIDPLTVADSDLEVAFPPSVELDQDEEWFVVEVDGDWKRLRLHDYAEIYSIPGLYERVVYDILKCRSPVVMRELLREQWAAAGCRTQDLTVLDLGAGNGCVAAELIKCGVRRFVGVDICPEAALAAARDRPGLYRDYVVEDLTDLSDEARQRLSAWRFDALVCVAALGFGDIPPDVFAAAYDRLEPNAWVAFTIKQDFLESSDRSGFAKLTRAIVDRGILGLQTRHAFTHRVALNGEELRYTALIGRKKASIPREMLDLARV